MTEIQIEQTAGEIIARAVLARAARGAFGVLVRDVPEFDLKALLTGLAPSNGGRLRVAMPGLAPSEAKQLRNAASQLGFDAEAFVTTVEGAERWRNDPAVRETIVVITPREIAKLNSLNRFQTLSADELYKQICRDAVDTLGVNDAQRQLWKAFQHKPVMKLVPLDGLIAYYGRLSSLAEDDIPTRSRELLYLLGFLPDPQLFSRPSAAQIARRLVRNHRVVDQVAVLSRTDRQRISRSLAARAGKKDSAALQTTYQKVMAFYREQNPERLADLTLEEVERLLRGRKGPSNDDQGVAEDGGDAQPGREAGDKPETRPEVRAVDLLLEEDDESLSQLAEAVRAVVDGEDGDDSEDEAEDPETGATLDVRPGHPFLKVVERYVGPSKWGGVIDSPASTLDEALALLDKAEYRPFDPDDPEWSIRQTLRQIVSDVGLDPGLVTAYDEFVGARRRLSQDVNALLLYPLVQLNSSREYFAEATRYLDSYKTLIEGLKQAYEAIAQVAPEGVEVLCSQILALDTIILRTKSGLKAILSPLHPLHLWKFIELSHQLRIQAGALTPAERDLLRSRIAELPNFVTTLYVSNYITGMGPRVLPEAGTRRGLPFFEELAHQYAGRDGIPEISRLLEKFCALYPHARLGLRVALIDPPDVDYLLRELVRMADSWGDELEGIHVRLFFTTGRSTSVAALGGGAEDEEGAERFRGVGTLERFTLEVHDEPVTPAKLADVMSRHPAHVVVYFDPSTARTLRFARSPSLTVHPLCLPMQFSFDRITKTVRVVPAADGGVFADHNDLRNRLSHQLTGSFFGVTAEMRAAQRDLQRLAEGCAWLVIADRAQEGVLSFDVPRVSLQRCGKRDVAVYSRDLPKFVTEFDRQLRRANYTPLRAAVERLIGDLGSLLSDGLLALVSQGNGSSTLDERRTRGLLGTLVTSAWYRVRHKRSLIVSIDSPEARRWLELRDDASRADLLGIVDEEDGSITIDLVEVKTYEEPENAYRVSGTEISGEAVSQLLSTARIIEEVLQLDPKRQRVVSPQRREVLRQQLFRECFFEGRGDDEKQYWSGRLNALFALDAKIRVRLSLVVVGLTQARASTEHPYRADGREVWLIELTEDVVRRYVSNEAPPPAAPDAASRAHGDAGDSSLAGEAERPDDANATNVEDDEEAGSPSPPQQPQRRRQGRSQAKDHSKARRGALKGDTPPPQAQEKVAALDEEERALIERKAAELRRILRDHGVQVKELDPAKAQIGPSVIRFRVRLRTGAKVSTLRSRAEDIGRELAARTTPFIDNIPGENYVGIDLERPKREVMPLLPAIQALPERTGSELPVAVGVTPAGEHVVLDLVQLPHILVAGSTMSGKTVFLHSVLLSFVARIPPSQLELLIIDPKATDFVLYNGLPHLRGGQVFTEPEDAIKQLRSLTEDELRSRTRTLQLARCPNLSEYNAANPETRLRPIVVVIDEYADLMAVLSKRERAGFEREVNRLAQRARSVGIHLILATQRPTADIVTGLLKANMPCRVSFRLPQRIDSQTILDQSGAENLFGRGDMLLLQNDRVRRLQGYYMPPTEMAEFLGRRFPGSGYAPVDAWDDDPLDLSVDDTDAANHEALVGEATCLAAGPSHDDLLDGATMTVEVELKEGGDVEVIGSAGDILKQSVLAAWRHVQQHAAEYGVEDQKIRGTGVTVHLVNIAEYREGPSAGLPFVVAIVSALTGRPVRPGLAMTGEVSLKGRVGAVGGVPQKAVAAFKRGRRIIILPRLNEPDLALVPTEVRDGLEVHLVDTASEAIEIALT